MNEELVFEEHECRIGPHPWKRFLSYNLAKIVYQLVMGAVVFLGFCAYPLERRLVFTILQICLFSIVSLFVDAILFSLFGTPFGKLIFGIRVLHESSRKLTLKEALGRNFLRWIYGEGCGIVGVSIYRNFRSYQACKRGEVLPWDDEVRYEFKDQKAVRGLVYVVCIVFVYIGSWWVSAKAVMPRIQGEWTREAFWENYTNTMTHVFHAEIYHPDMEFKETGENLEEIRIEREEDSPGHIKGIGSELAAVYAVVGMEPGRGGFDYTHLMQVMVEYGREQTADFHYEDEYVSINRTKDECVITIKKS